MRSEQRSDRTHINVDISMKVVYRRSQETSDRKEPMNERMTRATTNQRRRKTLRVIEPMKSTRKIRIILYLKTENRALDFTDTKPIKLKNDGRKDQSEVGVRDQVIHPGERNKEV